MGTSFHPPYGQFTVNVNQADHAGVQGVSDFVTNDELYMGIEYSDDNDVFMSGDSEEGTYQWGGKETHMPAGTFPLGWTRSYGDGKVFVTLLGHNGLSFETPGVPADCAQRGGLGHGSIGPNAQRCPTVRRVWTPTYWVS